MITDTVIIKIIKKSKKEKRGGGGVRSEFLHSH